MLSNTHLQFNAVASKNLVRELYGVSLSQAGLGYNYIKLRKRQDPAKIAEEIKTANKNLYSGIMYRLEPIAHIHLYSHARYELSPNSSIRYIYFLLDIAILLLIIVGINFTSLSIAQNLQRFKEAGIRKALGLTEGNYMVNF